MSKKLSPSGYYIISLDMANYNTEDELNENQSEDTKALYDSCRNPDILFKKPILLKLEHVQNEYDLMCFARTNYDAYNGNIIIDFTSSDGFISGTLKYTKTVDKIVFYYGEI